MDKNKDLNDLTRSVLYEEVPNQNLVRLTALVIGSGFLMFIGWAGMTNVNEVTRTNGEIIPSGYAQIVQHLEGGIIAEIMVEEGDLVEQGEVLVRMGAIGAEQDLGSLEERQTTLQLQAERLRALAYDETPDFSEYTGDNAEAVSYQQRLLDTALQAYRAEMKVLQDQLEQRKQSLARLQGEQETAQTELAAGQEQLEMRRPLVESGSVSRAELIDAEREVNQLEGNLRSIAGRISEAENAISEAESRIQTLEAQTRDKALQELEEVETRIAQNIETLGKLEGRVDRQAIRAPVRGLVQGLRVNTIGGVIGPGEPIMEIVPLDRTLIVEAQIPPREIGNLKVGQPARIKVSAFDFSRHGVIEGKLEFLSATTFVNEQNQSFYKGRIKLATDHVGPNPDRNLILPGMTVQADIITGEKTVLAYLLKPIHTSLDTAFRER